MLLVSASQTEQSGHSGVTLMMNIVELSLTGSSLLDTNIYYGFSLQCSVCHDSARNKKKKSFVDILREKNGWCFLIAAATTSNPLFYICEHLSNPQTRAGPPPLLLLPSVTFFTLLPCHPPLLLLYCTVLNETEESASMILSLETILDMSLS